VGRGVLQLIEHCCAMRVTRRVERMRVSLEGVVEQRELNTWDYEWSRENVCVGGNCKSGWNLTKLASFSNNIDYPW
jgi:hypothetical protein